MDTTDCLLLEVTALYMQIISGDLEMDIKLLSDCLMSLAVFEAWQEPLYLHLVTQARTLPLAAYGPRSLRHIYQVCRLAGLSCTLLHVLEHAGCRPSAWTHSKYTGLLAVSALDSVHDKRCFYARAIKKNVLHLRHAVPLVTLVLQLSGLALRTLVMQCWLRCWI